MSTDRKPHPSAVLKNLPEEKQFELLDYMEGTATTAGHTYKATLAWLQEAGITTWPSGLCEFRRWYRHRRRMRQNEATSLETVKECVERGWIKTRKEEEEAGQLFFNQLTLADEDAKAWVMVQGVSLKRDRLALEERKLKLMEDRHAQTKEIVNNTQMTTEQKEERIRQIMGLE
jgi:hypothetical protein